jgi:hypothetical protein
MCPYLSTGGKEQTSSQKTAPLIQQEAMAEVQKPSNRSDDTSLSVYFQV